jgi:4-hydroxybenzoate polyprenyltransferase
MPLSLIKLVRPRQWVKNVIVLAPLVFASRFLDPHAIRDSVVAAALFCVGSGAAYILNDLIDAERDRRHPEKRRKRPIAAGEVKPAAAVTLLLVLYGALLAAAFWEPPVIAAIGGYLVLNALYNVRLKHVPVVDIFVVAAGFVLRFYAGALAIDVVVSPWALTTIFSLALYLAAIKRRQELDLVGGRSRPVLAYYSVRLIDRYADLAAVASVVFYCVFVTTAQPVLVGSVPVVLFGLFRYWYLVEQRGLGGDPTEVLLRDPVMLATAALWVGIVVYLLWSRMPAS